MTEGDDVFRRVEALPLHLRHLTLCFDTEARRMWIRPNPEDPTTRFVDLMNGVVMTEREYTLFVRISDTSVVRVREVEDRENEPTVSRERDTSTAKMSQQCRVRE